jgi:hypothetical protein
MHYVTRRGRVGRFGSVGLIGFVAAIACDGGTSIERDGSVMPLGAEGGTSSQDAGAVDGGAPRPFPPVSTLPSSPAGASPAAPCAKADLTVTRTIPTVWLLVDGSGSMGDGFAGLGIASRWSALRDALLNAQSGFVAKLAGSVAFGLMVYDGGNSPPGIYVPGVCPRTVVVQPALANLAAISAAYPAQPLGASTPTHYALEDLRQRISAAGPSPTGPTYVLLATDGKPNLCDYHDGVPATYATELEAVATVADLAGRGIHTFALSMAGGNAELRQHLEALAQAGATGHGAFAPTTQDALVEALTQTIGGAASCDVRLEGSLVAGRDCSGEVALNGQKLVCNGPDGYRVREDRTTLELLGAACNTLQTTPQTKVTASFACDDVILR